MNFLLKAVAAGVVGYSVAKVLEKYEVAEKLTVLADELLSKVVTLDIFPKDPDAPPAPPVPPAFAGDGYQPRFGGDA